MNRNVFNLEMLLEKFMEKVVLITLLGSTIVIAVSISFRLFGIVYLSGGSTIWLIAMVFIGYVLSVARIVFSDYLLPHKTVMNEVEMFLMKWASPFIMTLSMLGIVFRLITLNPYIHFYLFIFSFFGFFIESYKEKDNMKEEYNHINSEISHRRDSDDRII